jgi:hypothetical protein
MIFFRGGRKKEKKVVAINHIFKVKFHSNVKNMMKNETFCHILFVFWRKKNPDFENKLPHFPFGFGWVAVFLCAFFKIGDKF